MQKKIIKKISEGAKRLIYPPVCPLCGELTEYAVQGVCGLCRPKLSYVKPPVCLKCGKQISDSETELCEDCISHVRSYVRGFPVFNYVAPLKESIAAFKYHNKRSYAHFYASEIVRCHGREIVDVAPDVLVPVPVHRARLKVRGYNQAGVLAKRLGELLDIAVDNEAVKRCVNTAPQKELDSAKREINLRNAFISADDRVQYKKVMLVDDIYTTGATIEACTRALMDAGVDKVYYTSICIGRGY